MFFSIRTIVCFFLAISSFHFNTAAAMEAPAEPEAAVVDELGARTKSAGQVFVENTFAAFSSHVKALTGSAAAVPDTAALQDCSPLFVAFSVKLERYFPVRFDAPENALSKLLHKIRHDRNEMIDLLADPSSVAAPLITLTRGTENLGKFVTVLCNSPRPLYVPEEVPAIFKRAIALCEAKAAKAKVQFSFDYKNLKGYFAKEENHNHAISMALGDLTENAIRYSSKAETRNVGITNEIIVDSIGGTFVRFSITDTGIGILPADLVHLGTTGFRGSNTSGFTGTGTGLSSCKELMAQVGGKLDISSPGLNLGSTFSFTAPVSLVENASSKKASSEDGSPVFVPRPLTHRRRASLTSLRGLRALVAEDNKVKRKIMEHQLKLLGLEVQTVEDGRAAVDVATSESGIYDAIFMDTTFACPGTPASGTGTAATRTIRKTLEKNGWLQPLILSMSASPDASCTDAGMDGHVSGNETPAQLRRQLEELLVDGESTSPVAASSDQLDELSVSNSSFLSQSSRRSTGNSSLGPIPKAVDGATSESGIPETILAPDSANNSDSAANPFKVIISPPDTSAAG